MLNSKQFALYVLTCSILFGCASNGEAQNMSIAEKKYKSDVSKTVLIHMNLETMFPNENLRSLADAAGRGDTRKISELVSSGLNVNARGNRNATALFWAMRNEKGFEKLLQLGADPNVVFDDGGTVMHWLARKNDCSMLQTALRYGGDPNLKAGLFNHSLIFVTITAGKNVGVTECFNVLVGSGADLNLTDNKGRTPILRAAELARYDIALTLLELGAVGSVKDIRGRGLLDISDGHKDAFRSGSVTEQNWQKLRDIISKN
ncbi:ankyrin repeat domain-containing protein [Vibrio maritimus]|jgi:ankyrin repeat protein